MAGFAQNIEQFRLVDGYDNYEVSSHGRIRNNKTARILIPGLNTGGYHRVSLSKDGKYKSHLIHKLVMMPPESNHSHMKMRTAASIQITSNHQIKMKI